jgi:hypothetical protein
MLDVDGRRNMGGVCCYESGCHRKQPLAIYLGDFSQQVFVVTRWRTRGDKAGQYVAAERHDVTEQVRDFLRLNRAWVLKVLEEAPTT